MGMLFLGLSVLTQSCDKKQSQIDQIDSIVKRAEQNKDVLSEMDWKNLDEKMQKLQYNLENNRKEYSEEQIRQVGKLQGKYAALLIKKELKDFQKSVNNLGSQMEGFIEGITDSSDNQNK
jgi:hypothetical protein